MRFSATSDFSMYLIKADDTLDVQDFLDTAAFSYEDEVRFLFPSSRWNTPPRSTMHSGRWACTRPMTRMLPT